MSELRKERSSTTIVLIGPYPPPYGGVSVHIQRLKERLLDAGMKCVVIDVASSSNRDNGTVLSTRAIRKWFAVLRQETCVIHVHVSGLYRHHNAAIIAALSMLSAMTRNKTIVTFHSAAGANIGSLSSFKKIVLRMALSRIHHFIAVAAAVREALVELGVNAERISTVPAFLPPRTRTEDFDEIPLQIWDFIGAHAPVITANAPNTDLYGGEDLYGMDLCIDLCANLQGLYRHHGFVFCIANVTDHDYLNELRQRIIEKRITDNFLFVTRSYAFYPFLTKSDLFIRPTTTDGDAISVREALYFKIPTIASDVAPRPRGTIEFANRSIDDLSAKVVQVLRDLPWYKTQLASAAPPDNFKKIAEIYDKVLGGN